jgi:biotin carboxyl carrier protein
VKKGDRVALMEAMKMQTPIQSEIDGIVTAISVKAGAALQPGDKILKIDLDQ